MQQKHLSVPAMLREAKSLHLAGHLGRAFRLAQAVIKEAPADVRGYVLAAELLEANFRYRASLDFVSRGLAVAAGHKQLALMNARLLRQVGDTAASVEAYEALMVTYPWSSSIKVDLAQALLSDGEAQRALSVIEEALSSGSVISRAAQKTLVHANVRCADVARAREILGQMHLESHNQLMAAIPDGAIAGCMASAGGDRNLVDHLPELVDLGKQPNLSSPLRAFLDAAGNVAHLSADRDYYFPQGRLPQPVARLDRALSSRRTGHDTSFVDSSSSVLGLTYRTTNLGDDVQSLATLNLTGKVKAFVDRDRLDEPGPTGKIVLNGWWGHHRAFPIATRDLSVAWPPRSDLDPLILSFHLDPLRAAMYLTSEGIGFLKAHEPIGCRDRWTERLLQRHGIRAYFSGCLTLTLPVYEGERTERVLLVDLPEGVAGFIGQAAAKHCRYRQKVLTHDIVRFTLDPVRRLNAAQLMLQQYARSAFVITTRLHVALPCLAMGTPVLFLPRDARDQRFDGLAELVNTVPLAEAMENGALFDPARWTARTDHLSLRAGLIETVRAFLS